jgi:hypothetical protein
MPRQPCQRLLDDYEDKYAPDSDGITNVVYDPSFTVAKNKELAGVYAGVYDVTHAKETTYQRSAVEGH